MAMNRVLYTPQNSKTEVSQSDGFIKDSRWARVLPFYRQADFAVTANHRFKIKENEKN